jgi:Mor family transcriptional regulator
MRDLPDTYSLLPDYRIAFIEQCYKPGRVYTCAVDNLVTPLAREPIKDYFNWLRDNDIIADRSKGLTIKVLCKKYNISASTISKISATSSIQDISEASALRKKEIIRLFDEGVDRSDLSQRFNCSKGLIYKILVNRKSKTSVRKGRRYLKRALKGLEAEMCQDFHNGYSIKYLSWKYSISASTLRYKCGTCNLEQSRKFIESLLNEGKSIKDIAKLLYRFEYQIKKLIGE